jgi:hypothetical protein
MIQLFRSLTIKGEITQVWERLVADLAREMTYSAWRDIIDTELIFRNLCGPLEKLVKGMWENLGDCARAEYISRSTILIEYSGWGTVPNHSFLCSPVINIFPVSDYSTTITPAFVYSSFITAGPKAAYQIYAKVRCLKVKAGEPFEIIICRYPSLRKFFSYSFLAPHVKAIKSYFDVPQGTTGTPPIVAHLARTYHMKASSKTFFTSSSTRVYVGKKGIDVSCKATFLKLLAFMTGGQAGSFEYCEETRSHTYAITEIGCRILLTTEMQMMLTIYPDLMTSCVRGVYCPVRWAALVCSTGKRDIDRIMVGRKAYGMSVEYVTIKKNVDWVVNSLKGTSEDLDTYVISIITDMGVYDTYRDGRGARILMDIAQACTQETRFQVTKWLLSGRSSLFGRSLLPDIVVCVHGLCDGEGLAGLIGMPYVNFVLQAGRDAPVEWFSDTCGALSNAAADGCVDAIAALISLGVCPCADIMPEAVSEYLARCDWPGAPDVHYVVQQLRGFPFSHGTFLPDIDRVIIDGPLIAGRLERVNSIISRWTLGARMKACMLWTGAPLFWPVQQAFRPLRARFEVGPTRFIPTDSTLVVGDNDRFDGIPLETQMTSY